MAGRPSQPARGRGGCRTAALGFPDVLDTIDSAAVRHWCATALDGLRAHQHEIDELNVYPVPDGDTGTNLVLTLTSAQQALDESPDSPSRDSLTPESPPPGNALGRMARGALLGARGNSGVIVSQILRGMADSLATSVAVRGGELARALRSATEAAYAAVARPVEGTVLSVVAAAAEGAGRVRSDDLVAVARAAARSAAEALARTPEQLPVLARAGVVDAGGRGLVLLLDALVDALAGEAPASGETTVVTVPDGDNGHIGYEVQYLLDAGDAAVGDLRQALGRLGDSLVVVGSGDGVWNVHVHVSAERIGPAVEAGVTAGRPHRISVTPLEPGRPHVVEPAESSRLRGAVVVA